MFAQSGKTLFAQFRLHAEFRRSPARWAQAYVCQYIAGKSDRKIVGIVAMQQRSAHTWIGSSGKIAARVIMQRADNGTHRMGSESLQREWLCIYLLPHDIGSGSLQHVDLRREVVKIAANMPLCSPAWYHMIHPWRSANPLTCI